MRLPRLAALPTAALLAVVGAAFAPVPAAAAVAVAASKALSFGHAARIAGENGHSLRVTPVGVYYYRPPANASIKPKQRYFVAIAIRVTALTKADRMPVQISSGMWRVESGVRMPLPIVPMWLVKSGARGFDTSSGNASTAPWAGMVNEGVLAVEPAHPEVVIETFDLPRKGGTFMWSTRNNGSIRWQIPTKNTGKTSYQQVLDALDASSGH